MTIVRLSEKKEARLVKQAAAHLTTADLCLIIAGRGNDVKVTGQSDAVLARRRAKWEREHGPKRKEQP